MIMKLMYACFIAAFLLIVVELAHIANSSLSVVAICTFLGCFVTLSVNCGVNMWWHYSWC